ncbi:reverse transcriptase domain-containing protein [Tanacetum coccineum]
MLGAALTWWNGHVRTLGHDAAYAMTWEILKKKLTDKYCPKGEIKKLEIELWNLKVKGNDVGGYTQRFQKLALMCTKFLYDETEKVDKYISGLPDNIHGNGLEKITVRSSNYCALNATITMMESVHPRHYMSDCPVLKNQGTKARGMVYALGGGEIDQDINNMEDDINA